jgi:hypothetical protein
METLEFIKKVEDGKLVIDVPAYMNNKDVKVTISADVEEDWTKFPVNKKLEILQMFAGSDRYRNSKTEDYDVYDQ